MSKEDDGDCGDEFDTVGLLGTCAKRVRKECAKSEPLFARNKTVKKEP